MLVPWWEGKPLASWMVITQMQMSEIKQRSSEMAKSFTLFSARCFPIGVPDLWGNLANLLGGESQNNGRTSKNSHTVGELFALLLSWSGSNYLQRHLINSKWHGLCVSPLGMVLERTIQNHITFHYLGPFLHGTIKFGWETKDTFTFPSLFSSHKSLSNW